ncbi:hypothetical protein SLS59_008459 [Nothophoma quercina]|uniref:Transcription factor domain-containing protein n=1 Tax=Nothophoma quercina TaxID=749835 RepID=A0ABR3QRX3_9PLEO
MEEEPSSEEEEQEDVKDLKSSAYATFDSAYYEDEEGDDDIVDLGIALGKVRITERIGGMVRPRFTDELGQALEELPKRESGDQSSVSAVDWMMPSNDYVAPSSSFLFTPGAERTTLMNYLPAKVLVDRLMAHYWQAVHVVARTVHRPSFERHYDKFWQSVASGIEPRNSFQAVVFAALLSAVISMSSDRVLTEFGVDKQGLVDNFREAAEAALSRANLLRTTKLETLQAFVMYLDPSAYGAPPIECQVRRLVWHQICFLDLRTCEATGPRPQIRSDDFDTRLPLNIDDIDLDRAEHGDRSIDVENDRIYFTDITISRMRFECYDMHRFLWVERPKLGKKRKEGERKVTISSLLARIQSFRARMEKTYLPMLSRTAPLHALASQIYGILSNRLYIHILQNYLSSDRHKMPERLRQVVISAAIMILEHSQNIEQQPALTSWSWYVGALHQYHTSLLLLSELYAQPCPPALEQRTWRVLDFVFDTGPGMTNPEKTRAVLEELRNKVQVYASVKRWRAPKGMPQAGPRTQSFGYQLRQREAEERARNASLHTGSSDQEFSNNRSPTSGLPVQDSGGSQDLSPPLQQTFRPPRLPLSQRQGSGSGVIDYPGAMPNTDWGTFDVQLPASTPSYQQPTASLNVYLTPNYPPATPSVNLMSPPRAMSQGSDPVASSTYAAPAGTAGSSPMDALNDLDWVSSPLEQHDRVQAPELIAHQNEIDQLFGSAEMEAGNMMIPPFTFPQFSATDLQWPPEGLQ